MDPIKLQAVRTFTVEPEVVSFALGSSDLSRQPVLRIVPDRKVSSLQAAVSPDCSYRLVKAAIDAARSEICLYIYNVSADHLVALLRDAKDRGVHIRLMYDVTDTRGHERDKLEALGVELKEAPSSGERKVFTVCHQKFAVIDESILLLGSANWAGTALPLVSVAGKFKKGNREWLVRIDKSSLARWFKRLFEADWDIPPLPVSFGIEEELPAEGIFFSPALPNLPQKIFDIDALELIKPVTVTPLLSPDNYFDVVMDLLRGAESSVDIEQQYILAGGPKTEALLGLLEQRQNELEIRIIVSPAFRKLGEKDTWELSVASLDAFNLKDCLRAMDLHFFTHMHNKGLIIDRRKVVISSTNWSENSITRAREAGVVIDSPEVAAYFAGVFDYDWSLACEPAAVPAFGLISFDAPTASEDLEEIHPADLA